MRAQGPEVKDEAGAVQFLRAAQIVLRYGSSPRLPLRSMFGAVSDQRLAFVLTNALLASGEAVESNVVADRLVLLHRELVPSVLALRTRHRAKRSAKAARALRYIEAEGSATAGDIRRLLGVVGAKRPDAADVALTELGHEMLIDRGPSSVAQNGIFYLSPEGYPYRVFAVAHPELLRAAARLSIPAAIRGVAAAVGDVPPAKLAAMCKRCFSRAELDAALGLSATLPSHGRRRKRQKRRPRA
jgi:hypothetical protein